MEKLSGREELGLQAGCLKRYYRKSAQDWQPDKNGGQLHAFLDQGESTCDNTELISQNLQSNTSSIVSSGSATDPFINAFSPHISDPPVGQGNANASEWNNGVEASNADVDWTINRNFTSPEADLTSNGTGSSFNWTDPVYLNNAANQVLNNTNPTPYDAESMLRGSTTNMVPPPHGSRFESFDLPVGSGANPFAGNGYNDTTSMFTGQDYGMDMQMDLIDYMLALSNMDYPPTNMTGASVNMGYTQRPQVGGFPAATMAPFQAQGSASASNPRGTRSHPCDICEKRFKRLSDLTRHIVTHDKYRESYCCPVVGCQQIDGYSRPDKLTEHMNKKHPGTPRSWIQRARPRSRRLTRKKGSQS